VSLSTEVLLYKLKNAAVGCQLSGSQDFQAVRVKSIKVSLRYCHCRLSLAALKIRYFLSYRISGDCLVTGKFCSF
jgi:hypothetical protein